MGDEYLSACDCDCDCDDGEELRQAQAEVGRLRARVDDMEQSEVILRGAVTILEERIEQERARVAALEAQVEQARREEREAVVALEALVDKCADLDLLHLVAYADAVRVLEGRPDHHPASPEGEGEG